MVTIKVKQIKPNFTRDFNGTSYKTEARLEWVKNNPDAYFDVAEITYLYCTEAKAKNYAYEDTNSIHEYWVDALEYRFDEDGRYKVFDFDPEIGGHRSTSVGDILEVNGVDYMVDSYGFSEVK